MKTWQAWQEWIDEEGESLGRLASSKEVQRLNIQAETAFGQSLNGKIDSGEDLQGLIIQSEILMLLKKEAEWVYVNGRRCLKASERMVAWGITVLERKDENAFMRVLKALSSVEEWEYWKRITIEFDKPEFLALIKTLNNAS